jgi:hypothetical protein
MSEFLLLLILTTGNGGASIVMKSFPFTKQSSLTIESKREAKNSCEKVKEIYLKPYKGDRYISTSAECIELQYVGN